MGADSSEERSVFSPHSQELPPAICTRASARKTSTHAHWRDRLPSQSHNADRRRIAGDFSPSEWTYRSDPTVDDRGWQGLSSMPAALKLFRIGKKLRCRPIAQMRGTVPRRAGPARETVDDAPSVCNPGRLNWGALVLSSLGPIRHSSLVGCGIREAIEYPQ
jgi:hypothetical protein